jgi:hypothetical protein
MFDTQVNQIIEEITKLLAHFAEVQPGSKVVSDYNLQLPLMVNTD